MQLHTIPVYSKMNVRNDASERKTWLLYDPWADPILDCVQIICPARIVGCTLEDSNNQAYVTYKGAGFGVAKDMLIAL